MTRRILTAIAWLITLTVGAYLEILYVTWRWGT